MVCLSTAEFTSAIRGGSQRGYRVYRPGPRGGERSVKLREALADAPKRQGRTGQALYPPALAGIPE